MSGGEKAVVLRLEEKEEGGQSGDESEVETSEEVESKKVDQQLKDFEREFKWSVVVDIITRLGWNEAFKAHRRVVRKLLLRSLLSHSFRHFRKHRFFKQLRRRIRKGIADSCRGYVWQVMTGSFELAEANAGLYKVGVGCCLCLWISK